ncbi:MAG: DNA-directed DNA polymerase II small subunit [bacterium]
MDATASLEPQAAGRRAVDLVALFESHGALAEPALLAELGASPDGPVRAQAVLSGLREVPFHFDREMWNRIEEQQRERTGPPPPPRTADPEAERARKDALRRAAGLVYDNAPSEESDGDETDDDADMTPAPQAPAPRQPMRIEPRGDWRPVAAEYAGRLEVVADMTGSSTCEGTTADFTAYFQDRYRQIAKMLRGRREMRNATAVERIRAGARDVQVIGMVVEVGTTKSGHKRVELEDETGAILGLVRNSDEALMAMADTLVPDEVIGVQGSASAKGDMLYIEAILRPDVPIPDHDRKRGAEVPVMAAFLSDIHVGSKTFLAENWTRMLRWLSGHGGSKRERDAAGRVKYLVIPGDLVDGVGIYPGQQHELSIPDIYDQYGAFGDWMAAVPDHVEIVVQPGNHDASRPAEPQPAFAAEVRNRFDHHKARFVANPATFRLHGVTTLGYHGNSLIDFAVATRHLEFNKPLATMKQMLQSRHLAPIYGDKTPVAPEHHDYLVISEVPDLFVTGHVHVPGIEMYRGVQMVNCGTWQSQTSYQKMLNFTPDPCRMPLIDLQTLRGTLVDFQSPQTAGEMTPQQG